MALYRRGKIWWIRFTTPAGQSIRKSTKTERKREAQEYHDRLKTSYWRREVLHEPSPRRWLEAVERWLDERGDYPSRRDDVYWLRWLYPHLSTVYLTDIDADRIDQIRRFKLAEGKANRTINAVLQTIRSVLKAAQRWGWIETIPPITLLPEPVRRVRFLSDDEEQRLLAELPDHLAEVTRFALATGLRMSNICWLEWTQVDLEGRRAWIHADQSKTRKAIAVPLNADAVLVLRRQQGKHPTRVFTFEGKPFNAANGRTWRNALKRAGIADFSFHCLRHTWATRHAQAGTPLLALQEMGGWNDTAMVRKYAHFAPEHLQQYAENLSRPKAVEKKGLVTKT